RKSWQNPEHIERKSSYMPLQNYGLLTGTLVDYSPQSVGNPHYLFIVQSNRSRYRISVNVDTTRGAGRIAQQLQYQIIDDMRTGSKEAKNFAARIKKRTTAGHAFTIKAQDETLPTLD